MKLQPMATIHYSELPLAQPGSPLEKEWNTYRKEIDRLLREGQEGKYVLIKGDRVVGIWSSDEEAEATALSQFLLQPVLIHQIRSQEPLIRGPLLVQQCHH